MHFIFKQSYQKRAKNYFTLKICEKHTKNKDFFYIIEFALEGKNIKFIKQLYVFMIYFRVFNYQFKKNNFFFVLKLN